MTESLHHESAFNNRANSDRPGGNNSVTSSVYNVAVEYHDQLPENPAFLGTYRSVLSFEPDARDDKRLSGEVSDALQNDHEDQINANLSIPISEDHPSSPGGKSSLSSEEIRSWLSHNETVNEPRPTPAFRRDLDPPYERFATDITCEEDVWKHYMTSSIHADTRLLKNWNSNMDVLLIFAGLFSAILTAFIIEFYHLLERDDDESTTDLLLDISAVLRASIEGRELPPNPMDRFEVLRDDYRVPLGVIWVNCLWFASLTCSLAAAIAAMVVKQWLQYYDLGLNSGSAHSFASQRQFRFNALKHWKVENILSLLPLLMHAAVGLFIIGLIILLWSIHVTVALVVLNLSALLVVSYLAALLMPLISPSCPYKSPAQMLLQHYLREGRVLFWMVPYAFVLFIRLVCVFSKRVCSWRTKAMFWARRSCIAARDYFVRAWRSWSSYQRSLLESPLQFFRSRVADAQSKGIVTEEQKMIEVTQDKINAECIVWLIKYSGSQASADAALACISQLKPEPDMARLFLRHDIVSLLRQKAFVPLPNPNHNIWRDLTRVTMDECIRPGTNMEAVAKYLQSMMSIWHHPDFLKDPYLPVLSASTHPKSVSSPRLTDGFAAATEDVELALSPDLHSPDQLSERRETTAPRRGTSSRLLGDWIILWRALKERVDHVPAEDFSSLAFKRWDLDCIALMICAEVHYYHLTIGPSANDKLDRFNIRGELDHKEKTPWSDIYELLYDYTSNELKLSPPTIACVLDTIIYVVSNPRPPPTHPPVFLKPQMLVLLLKIFKGHGVKYDAVFEKLCLCLRVVGQAERWQELVAEYWKRGGEVTPNRKKAYADICGVLQRLPLRCSGYLEDEQNMYGSTILTLSCSSLLDVLREIDKPTNGYNVVFLQLSVEHASSVLETLYQSHLHTWQTDRQLVWMIDLLLSWCDSDAAQSEIVYRLILNLLGDFLSMEWNRSAMEGVCGKILPFMKRQLLREDPFSDIVSRTVCRSLRSTLPQDKDLRKQNLLFQCVAHGFFESISAYLDTDIASGSSKDGWIKLLRAWSTDRKDRDIWNTSSEEREAYARFKERMKLHSAGRPAALESVTPPLPAKRPRPMILRQTMSSQNLVSDVEEEDGILPPEPLRAARTMPLF